MKRLLIAVALLFLVQAVQAVTVWYQPTPYPLKKSDTTSMPQDLDVVHVWDGWVSNSVGSMAWQADDSLWLNADTSDNRVLYIKFDLVGLPDSVDSASLWLMPYGVSSSAPYPDTWLVTQSWNRSTILWSAQPSTPTYLGWLPPATSGTWWGQGITTQYNNWKSSSVANNGWMWTLAYPGPYWTAFRSSRYAAYGSDPYADGKRPALQMTFTPTLTLKMPLPGGDSWLLTNEVGGHECKGEAPFPDTAHTDSGSFGNYYSLDISWINSGSTYGQYNTPVLAAGGGKVIDVGGGNSTGDFNGFYIVIDHDSDGNINTGFSTRYLHLKQAAARANGGSFTIGDSVNQGDQIGIVGKTGKDGSGNPTATGEHLHFGVRYGNQGYSNIPQLAKVVMDGWILKSFQTECAVNGSGVPTSRIRYYSSSNTPTGN